MALMPMGSKVPMTGPVRYSHVAHFVGLSLLRDPNIAQRKPNKSASTGNLGATDGYAQPAQSVDSLPSLSVERVDQLRAQIGLLKAERRAEKEQLKKLEHSLSDSMLAEKRAHARAQAQRQAKDEHEKSLRHVTYQIAHIKEANQKTLRSTWPGSDNAASGNSDSHPASREVPQSPTAQDEVATMSATAPSGFDRAGEPLRVQVPLTAATLKLAQRNAAAPLQLTADMFDNAYELAQHRREIVRKEIMLKAERRNDPSGQWNGGRSVTFFEMRQALIDLRLNVEQLQEYWERLTTVEASDVITAFGLINLNGSGRISSQEFADGVYRIGVQWQKLTGLKRPKDLFRLFDQDKDGVITLYELFPTHHTYKKDDTGATTPELWKTYCVKNPLKSFCLEQPKGRAPPWSTGVADDSLAIMKERERKDAEAVYMKKWLTSTMRRLKGRGKSDARVREMCCLHLPKGTGPLDRQGVSTFSESEVKQCKREYSDAVMEPQRTVLKDLFELREIRKELSTSRHKLFAVALEPYQRQQELENQKNFAQSLGLGLHLHHEDLADIAPAPPPPPQPAAAPKVDNAVADGLHEMTPHS